MDVIMADAVDSKRSAHPTGGQPKLQKKKTGKKKEDHFSNWQR